MTMYRKHEGGNVVDVDNVSELISETNEIYLEWLEEGNIPLEQAEVYEN